MIVAKVNTNKGSIYIVAEDESDARSKSTKHLQSRYFSKVVQINSTEVLACDRKFYSNNTLIL
jgi:hypothetical protein